MLSDFELVQLASPGKTDGALVTDLVRHTLDDLALSPPIDHDVVASYRGVERIERTDIPWSGRIVLTEEGLVIAVRESDPSRRQRFTIFHEILHTYMRGFYHRPQYRCDPDTATLDRPCDPTLERLCDHGAAELLLPQAELLNDITGNTVNLDLVDELSHEYEASRTATASRICSVNPARTMFLTLEVATKPRDPLGEPKLRVQSCVGAADWHYVPKHKSAAPGGVFDRALQGEVVDETLYLDELTRDPVGWANVSARRSDFVDSEGAAHIRVRALVTQKKLTRMSR